MHKTTDLWGHVGYNLGEASRTLFTIAKRIIATW